jgi:hypothetical protein
MARPLDPRQQRELTDFVNSLFEASGYKSTADWARESGYLREALSKLRNARGGVDGYNLLKLIRSASAHSALTPEQLAVALLGGPDADQARVLTRLEALEARVAELPTADDLRGGLESLRRSIAQASQDKPAARSESSRNRSAS